MKKIMIFLLLAAMTSCSLYDIDEVLLQRDEISMTMKGVEQFVYDPVTCQMSHNATTNEYRMFNDKLSDWLIVKCYERPSNEGQDITADVTWTASSSTKSIRGLTFSIEKMDASGTVWMWCRQKSIGIVIKNL